MLLVKKMFVPELYQPLRIQDSRLLADSPIPVMVQEIKFARIGILWMLY